MNSVIEKGIASLQRFGRGALGLPENTRRGFGDSTNKSDHVDTLIEKLWPGCHWRIASHSNIVSLEILNDEAQRIEMLQAVSLSQLTEHLRDRLIAQTTEQMLAQVLPPEQAAILRQMCVR